jgi:DNA-directed RNA polymerase subunit RPC12/RpoP
MAIYCSSCGNTIAEHWQTCVECSAPVPSRPPDDPLPGYRPVRCPSCLGLFHAQRGRVITYCTECGAFVRAPRLRP